VRQQCFLVQYPVRECSRVHASDMHCLCNADYFEYGAGGDKWRWASLPTVCT